MASFDMFSFFPHATMDWTCKDALYIYMVVSVLILSNWQRAKAAFMLFVNISLCLLISVQVYSFSLHSRIVNFGKYVKSYISLGGWLTDHFAITCCGLLLTGVGLAVRNLSVATATGSQAVGEPTVYTARAKEIEAAVQRLTEQVSLLTSRLAQCEENHEMRRFANLPGPTTVAQKQTQPEECAESSVCNVVKKEELPETTEKTDDSHSAPRTAVAFVSTSPDTPATSTPTKFHKPNVILDQVITIRESCDDLASGMAVLQTLAEVQAAAIATVREQGLTNQLLLKAIQQQLQPTPHSRPQQPHQPPVAPPTRCQPASAYWNEDASSDDSESCSPIGWRHGLEYAYPVFVDKSTQPTKPRPPPQTAAEVQIRNLQTELANAKKEHKAERERLAQMTPEEKTMTLPELRDKWARDARAKRGEVLENRPLNEEELELSRPQMQRRMAKSSNQLWYERQVKQGIKMEMCICGKWKRVNDPEHWCRRPPMKFAGKGPHGEAQELLISGGPTSLRVTKQRTLDMDTVNREAEYWNRTQKQMVEQQTRQALDDSRMMIDAGTDTVDNKKRRQPDEPPHFQSGSDRSMQP